MSALVEASAADVPLVDLAARHLGGSVVAASDESFGEKENLLVEAAPIVAPGRFGHKGEIVDGWETRRLRVPGHDWAVIRLGASGIVRRIVVDTRGFTGNQPPRVLVEGRWAGRPMAPFECVEATDWTPLTETVDVAPDTLVEVPAVPPGRHDHVRLSIFPDGGVARLRILGEAVPDPSEFDGLVPDLADPRLGGLVVASSDEFYSSASNLLRPGPPRTMGEGWEARRRRGPGHDWAVVRLAGHARLRRVVVDTTCFVANASAHARVLVASSADGPWTEIAQQPLVPDAPHVLDIPGGPEATHVRLDALPDAGIGRLRVFGTLTPAGLAAVRDRWDRT